MQTFILRTVDKSTGESSNVFLGKWFSTSPVGTESYDRIVNEHPRPDRQPDVVISGDGYVTWCYFDTSEYYIMTSDGKTFEKIS